MYVILKILLSSRVLRIMVNARILLFHLLLELTEFDCITIIILLNICIYILRTLQALMKTVHASRKWCRTPYSEEGNILRKGRIRRGGVREMTSHFPTIQKGLIAALFQ